MRRPNIIAQIPHACLLYTSIDVLLGSNCGYFIGFILASYFIVTITDKYADARNFTKMAAEMCIRDSGKSTVNDFLGIRTEASDLNYGFDHGKEHILSLIHI